jgi:toxin FitB
MNIVDAPCRCRGTKIVENIESLIVPTIIMFEVFKKIITELDEDKALFAVAHMKQGTVIDLNSNLAIFAAQIGKQYKRAMADSIIYATAFKNEATLYTQDKHFKDLKFVKYFEKN